MCSPQYVRIPDSPAPDMLRPVYAITDAGSIITADDSHYLSEYDLRDCQAVTVRVQHCEGCGHPHAFADLDVSDNGTLLCPVCVSIERGLRPMRFADLPRYKQLLVLGTYARIDGAEQDWRNTGRSGIRVAVLYRLEDYICGGRHDHDCA